MSSPPAGVLDDDVLRLDRIQRGFVGDARVWPGGETEPEAQESGRVEHLAQVAL